ncbi:MAG: hypothetical protein ABEI52_05790 [Halobacteriaceae archaeon]
MAKYTNWNRRHFEDTASVIRDLSTSLSWRDYHTVAITFADLFEAANPGFNRVRFLKACGFPVAEPGETPGDDE